MHQRNETAGREFELAPLADAYLGNCSAVDIAIGGMVMQNGQLFDNAASIDTADTHTPAVGDKRARHIGRESKSRIAPKQSAPILAGRVFLEGKNVEWIGIG